MNATLQQIEGWIRNEVKNCGDPEAVYRRFISEGICIWSKQAGQVFEHMKRGEGDQVIAFLTDALREAYGKQALAYYEERQRQIMSEVGGSIHERGETWRKAV